MFMIEKICGKMNCCGNSNENNCFDKQTDYAVDDAVMYQDFQSNVVLENLLKKQAFKIKVSFYKFPIFLDHFNYRLPQH